MGKNAIDERSHQCHTPVYKNLARRRQAHSGGRLQKSRDNGTYRKYDENDNHRQQYEPKLISTNLYHLPSFYGDSSVFNCKIKKKSGNFH